jgi:hypothetical protein
LYGDSVEIPASDSDVVVARFSGIRDSLRDQIESLLLRSPNSYIRSGGPLWYAGGAQVN